VLDEILEHNYTYGFTNETLREYMPLVDVAGKDVLTVMASGDHPATAALLGAKKMTCFDINRFALLWGGLKLAAFKTLTSDQFMQLFFDEREGPIKNKDYLPVRDALDPETLAFFDEFVKRKILREDCLVDNPRSQLIEKRVLYLDHEKYEATQKALCNCEISAVQSDIFDLPHLQQKYDAMFFSNIDSKVPADKYRRMMEHDVPEMLKDGGTCVAAYRYKPVGEWDDFHTELFRPDKLAKRGINVLKHEFKDPFADTHHVVALYKS